MLIYLAIGWDTEHDSEIVVGQGTDLEAVKRLCEYDRFGENRSLTWRVTDDELSAEIGPRAPGACFIIRAYALSPPLWHYDRSKEEQYE